MKKASLKPGRFKYTKEIDELIKKGCSMREIRNIKRGRLPKKRKKHIKM